MAKVKFDASAFIEKSLQKVVNKTQTLPAADRAAEKLAAQLARAANVELNKMFPWIAEYLMGTKDSYVGQYQFFQGPSDKAPEAALKVVRWQHAGGTSFADEAGNSPRWHWLSNPWVKQKGNRQFWTGPKSILRRQAADWIATSKFGPITVTYTRPEKVKVTKGTSAAPAQIILGGLKVKVIPKVNSSQLPFLKSGQWANINPAGTLEKKFFTPLQAKKLVGRDFRHRPLVQPVLGYWLKYRVPAAMGRALEAVIARQARNTKSGIKDVEVAGRGQARQGYVPTPLKTFLDR